MDHHVEVGVQGAGDGEAAVADPVAGPHRQLRVAGLGQVPAVQDRSVDFGDDAQVWPDRNVDAEGETEPVGDSGVEILLAGELVGHHSREHALGRYGAPFPVGPARGDLGGREVELAVLGERGAFDRHIARQPDAEGEPRGLLRGHDVFGADADLARLVGLEGNGEADRVDRPAAPAAPAFPLVDAGSGEDRPAVRQAEVEGEGASPVAVEAGLVGRAQARQIAGHELLFPGIHAEDELACAGAGGRGHREQPEVAPVVRRGLRPGSRRHEAEQHRQERGSRGLHEHSFRTGRRKTSLPNRISQNDGKSNIL